MLKVTISKEDFELLTELAKEGISGRGEIKRLKSDCSRLSIQNFDLQSDLKYREKQLDALITRCRPCWQAAKIEPEKEWAFYEQEQQKIDGMMCYLAGLSKEQRFQWYREHQYCYPIGFDKEIGGTVYIVTAHFSKNASEGVEEKTERILTKN